MSSADAIDIDPDDARERREARHYRLNTFQIPLLRAAGFAVLLALVWLHMRFLQEGPRWELLPGLLTVVVAYCLVSWILLRVFYLRYRPADLQLPFLLLDYVFYMAALHITGGSRSGLLFILLAHVVDQTASFRRSLFFAHIAALCYLALLLLTAHDELQWAPELARAAILYGAGLYVSLTARASESMRARLRAAVRVTRDLVRQLHERTAELEAAMRDTEQANRAKSVFLATMTHELCTPLNAVIGFAELLLDNERDLPYEQRVEFLQYIHNAGRHLLSLLRDVLDLARLESGHLLLEKDTVDIAELVVAVAAAFENQARERRLTLTLDCPPGAHLLEVDSRRLQQVLANLMSNAVRFTPQGGAVGLKLRCVDEAIEIEVFDNGIGIDVEHHERVFEGFFKAGQEGRPTGEGVGLGLALSRRLVHVLGGTLQMASAPGQGTTITVRFPDRNT